MPGFFATRLPAVNMERQTEGGEQLERLMDVCLPLCQLCQGYYKHKDQMRALSKHLVSYKIAIHSKCL